MTTWRRLGALGIGALLLTTAIGTADAQDVTLSFPTWQAEEPGFGEWWREMVDTFEAANDGVRIEMQQIPYRDYVNQLTIRFASNRPPDILVLPSGSFGAFADQGWLEPLDERIKDSDFETEWSSLQSELVWDDKTQGVLLMGYGFMLFYNSEILEAAGVEPPDSFDAFQAAVPELTDRDAGVFGLAAVTTEHPTAVLDFIRFITWAGADLIANGNYNLTDPAVVEAIENYRATVGGNAPLGNNSTIARQLFIDGRTGFLIDGPWVWARLHDAPEGVRDQLEMVPAPFEPPLGGASNSIHIPAGLPAERKDLVWSFIEHVGSAEAQREYIMHTASPPGRVDILSDEDMAAHPHLDAIAEAAIGAGPVIPNVQAIMANVNEFSAIIERAALRVLSTEVPVETILEEAQGELERAVPLS